MILPFGKYRGMEIENVPFTYVVWVAGKAVGCCRKRAIIENVLDDLVRTIWMRRFQPWNCHCGEALDQVDKSCHELDCMGCCAESTLAKTREKTIELIFHRNATFDEAEKLYSWMWVYRHHPAVVQEAATFVEQAGCCYACGGHLVPIGHLRENGADCKDWTTRRLHKQCWKELEIDKECCYCS